MDELRLVPSMSAIEQSWNGCKCCGIGLSGRPVLDRVETVACCIEKCPKPLNSCHTKSKQGRDKPLAGSTVWRLGCLCRPLASAAAATFPIVLQTPPCRLCCWIWNAHRPSRDLNEQDKMQVWAWHNVKLQSILLASNGKRIERTW